MNLLSLSNLHPHVTPSNTHISHIDLSIQVCRCTGNGGAMIHLLEGPIMAYLHQHNKFFIDKSKYSASTRPLRMGAPRGGTRPARRGFPITPRGASSSLQGRRASFTAKEPPPGRGKTWLSHVQATLHHRKTPRVKDQASLTCSSLSYAPRVDPTLPLWGYDHLLVLQ